MSFYSKINLENIIDKINIEKNKKIKKQNKSQMFKDLKCFLNECSFPNGKNEWLSAIDIDFIMEKNEKKFKDFQYLGTFPLDFKNLFPEIFNLDLNKLIKKRFGIVFNISKSTEEGEHWISLFIDTLIKNICFFDSAALPIPYEVKNFIDKINYNNNYSIIENYNPVQKKDGTCGLFAIYFINQRLNGMGCFDIFKDKNLNDENMEKLRKQLFK